MENPCFENENAATTSRAPVSASSGDSERTSPDHWWRALSIPFRSKRLAADVGEHTKCCSAAPWLQQGGGNDSRISRHGGREAKRNGAMERGRNRATTSSSRN